MPLYSYNNLLSEWKNLAAQEKNITLNKFDPRVLLGKIESLDDKQNIKFDNGYKVIPQTDDTLFLYKGNEYDSHIGKKDEKMFATTTGGGRRRRRRRTSKTVKRKSRKSKRKMYSRRR